MNKVVGQSKLPGTKRSFLNRSGLMPALVCAGVVAWDGSGTEARAQSSRATPLTAAVQKTSGSVLSLEVVGSKAESGAGGSAVIVDERGYAVTNRHVVRNAVSIEAYLPDYSRLVAEVVFEDHRHDLAILKLPTDRKLKALKLGSSTDLLIGETVFAVGNPKGLPCSVSSGTVSGLEREIYAESICMKRMIQTNVPINPGNSGGPLINLDGEVIGIIVAVRKDAQGIAFAIPSDTVKEVLGSYLSARIASVRTSWDWNPAGKPRAWLYHDVAKAAGNRTPPADLSSQLRETVVPRPEIVRRAADSSRSDSPWRAGEAPAWPPPDHADATGNAFLRNPSAAHPNEGVAAETLGYAAVVYACFIIGVVAFQRCRAPSYRCRAPSYPWAGMVHSRYHGLSKRDVSADETAPNGTARKRPITYKCLPESSEAMVYWAMTRLMVRRLTGPRRRLGAVPAGSSLNGHALLRRRVPGTCQVRDRKESQ